MALHGFGEKLHSGLATTVTTHLQEVSASIEAARDDQFLEELNRRWSEHDKALTVIRDLLALMDTTNVSESHKTPVLRLGLDLWRDNVIHSKEIEARLPHALLRIIQRERMGEKDFEKPFLDDSAIFYAGESRVLIECCDCREYLKMVERRLGEEKERASHYLADRTEPKILGIVEEEMIAKHMRRLVHMDSGGVSTIRDLMTSHLRETGQQLSLACVPDMNVLCKNPMNNDIAEDDVFCVNDNFTSNLFQVKIDTAAAEEESEQQEIRQKVEEARKYQIDAAIIRVMKAQRVLNLNSLVTEVAKQLQPRVLPDPAVIKKRIESLIEREYLEDNRNQYQYIA
ncbi:Cullin protein neddylation domain [Musa troglodytarum]|uniref:Cullin protein neddylation domain n=1 Tax=Musa troglodytarum TaxID=320322 RepID=A0A9E7EZH8_9LILI|nr:Cullin protein neddylation domain [Musa troglodytarum]